jgi:hypothetical protein
LIALNAVCERSGYSRAVPTSQAIRLSSLLLPREHGSWSIVLEPVALGLLTAPSAAGAALAGAVVSLFLARRPLRLWLDARNTAERRRHAARAYLTLTMIAVGAGLTAGKLGGIGALWPLLLPLPAAALFVWFDLQSEPRAAAAELAGATAFALLPLAFGTLAGAALPLAVGLTVAMVVRLVPTMLVVRAYLRGQKGQPASPGIALSACLAGIVLAATLVASGLATGTTLALAILLTVRAAWLLGPRPPQLRAPVLGGLEASLGAGCVLALAFS